MISQSYKVNALACALLLISPGVFAQETDPRTVTTEEVRAAADQACADGKTYTIAFTHPVSENPIVGQVRHFADVRAAELGCVTVMHDNTQANNLESQINAVQGWITLGVDAIVVTPIDEAALKPLQTQAQAQGIKWLTYMGTMSGSEGYVGFDHAQSGQIIGQAAIDWVRANNIQHPKALVTTLTTLPILAPRWVEVENLFRDAGIEVVARQDASNQASGLTVTETVLQQHPDLSIVIGISDDTAVGAYRAVTVAGLPQDQFFIGGQDGSFEGLSAVNEGKSYRASAAILINDLGANVTDLAVNAVTGLGPSYAYTPTVLASKADQAQLDALLANYAN